MLDSPTAAGFFEGLGFSYLGPVDGHDLPSLFAALREAKRAERPMVVHALTQKGRGFPAAEADARTRGHAMGPYELRDGKLVRSRAGLVTFSEAFAQALEERMAADPRVVAVTPAMVEGSALSNVKARFPDRVYDVGIAEQHAVTFSAGLAAGGLRPVCLIYSTFLQRAVDQVVHDVCIPGLPVVLAVDRAGLVGADGATHQGMFDIAFLRGIPGMAVMAPVLGDDLPPLLDAALARHRPTALRFPRGTLPLRPVHWPEHLARVPRARWLRRPDRLELVLVTLGPLGLAALEAAESHPTWGVLDACCASPLDEEALRAAAACGRLVTVEEGTVHGGLGSGVLESLAAWGLTARVKQMGLPDAFVRHGDARAQRNELGLDPAGITRIAQELLSA
jgi:1-deoxy-D-xylulose-5-phosphate synthase